MPFVIQTRRMGGWATFSDQYLTQDHAVGVAKSMCRAYYEDDKWPGMLAVRVLKVVGDTYQFVWEHTLTDPTDSGGE